MKTIEEIRRERLEKLIDELNDQSTGRGGVSVISENCGISDTQISQWRNASGDHKSGRPRAMHSDSARKIERGCNKEVGWMDNPLPLPVQEQSPFSTRDERLIEEAIRIFRGVGAEGKAILIGVLRSESRHLTSSKETPAAS